MIMLCKYGFLSVVLLLLLHVNNALCQESADISKRLQHIDMLLNQGDNQQAMQLLQSLPEAGPSLDDKLWRMARVQYEMGRIAESDQSALICYQNAEK